MKKQLLHGLLVFLLFIVIPVTTWDRYFLLKKIERENSQKELFFQNMEDVLHRVQRNGQPEFLAKNLLDQTRHKLRKGFSVTKSISKLASRADIEWDIFLFSPSGDPQPIANKKITRYSAWQKLMKAILRYKIDGKVPSTFEDKLAEQLLGDRTAIRNLCRSVNFFRKMGNPTKYTHGSWWPIYVGNNRKIRGHLLVMLRKSTKPEFNLLKIAFNNAAKKCRKLFQMAYVIDTSADCPANIPREVWNQFNRLAGGQGRFEGNQFIGVASSLTDGPILLAWKIIELHKPSAEDDYRFLGIALAIFATLILSKIWFTGEVFSISLKLLIPLFILAGTIPSIAFFLFVIQEQRKNTYAKDVYQTHRKIEETLRGIDNNFADHLKQIAGELRDWLELYVKNNTTSIYPFKINKSIYEALHSGYIIDSSGVTKRILFRANFNPTADQKMMERLVKQLMNIVYGINPGEPAEEPVFNNYLSELGRFVEAKILDETTFQFLDFKSLPYQNHDLIAICINLIPQKVKHNFIRKILKSPQIRQGIELALFSYEENSLINAIPNAFFNSIEGKRLAEKVMENGRTIDSILTLNSGRKLIATAMPGRNLSGFILLGAKPLEEIIKRDFALSFQTLAISIATAILVILSTSFLVKWTTNSLEIVEAGANAIRNASFREIPILQTSDEFGKLTQGLEKAAITLEELYSSKPIQEALVSCQPIQHPEFSLSYIYEPASRPCGDYFDGFPLPGNKFLIAIGDTLGEGWQTTLVVAAMRMAIRLIWQTFEHNLTLAMERVHKHFMKIRGTTGYMSLWMGILHFDTSELEWISSGHCPPILIKNGRAILLPSQGVLLGRKQLQLENPQKTKLDIGDRLVVYTNAWFLMTSQSNKSFLEIEGFLQTIEEIAETSDELWISSLREQLQKKGFVGPIDDDRSLITILRKNVNKTHL